MRLLQAQRLRSTEHTTMRDPFVKHYTELDEAKALTTEFFGDCKTLQRHLACHL